MDNDNNEEIIIGVNIPKKSKKNIKYNKKEAVKKTASKEKKNKARIFGNSHIFRNRVIRKCILLFLICIAIILFLSSSVFDIKNIQVINNEIVSQDEIISLSQIGNQKNIFSLNSKLLKNNLMQNAYIENFEIIKNYPNTIVIDIKERKIKYMIQLGDAYVYLDKKGYILDISNEEKEFPILLGIATDITELKSGNRLSSGDLTKLDIVNRIYEVAKNNDILSLITKIDISNSKNYVLYLDGENKIAYLGDCTDLNTRILYVKAILEQESGIEGEIFVNVDLNEQNVFFREKI